MELGARPCFLVDYIKERFKHSINFTFQKNKAQAIVKAGPSNCETMTISCCLSQKEKN